MRHPEVRLLHTAGCSPDNTEAARAALEVALVEAGLPAGGYRIVLIRTEEEAVEQGFVGGPAILVDGVDVDPAVRGMKVGGLGCRAYFTADGISGAPPVEMIEAALRGAMAE
ncbi:MAG TPA: hypothetical protein VFD74_02485 [Thermoleophilia bacterium]|nr:hypothetical protein [Thermoleophilia bacterium]